MIETFERRIMKKIFMAVVLFVLSLSFGCFGPPYWEHEERMAVIKANQKAEMSEQDKAQLADMVADRVVEKMKQK
jgi:hypothetical protein